MENIFEQAFINSLNEQVKYTSPEMTDEQALETTLDPGTLDTQHLDVHAADRRALQAKVEYQTQMVAKLDEWIVKISEFCKFLNEPGTGSIQAVLNKAIPETIMDKIKTSETKRIARVASELGSLNEMLKGYRNTSDDASYRGV